MSFNLIVPIAADALEERDEMPYLFSQTVGGVPLVVNAILGLDLTAFDSISFTILQKHDKQFSLRKILEKAFYRVGIQDQASVVVLEHPTRNQPETICRTLEKRRLSGAIMVKDADNFFLSEVMPGNYITVLPLDALTRVNPQDKSYVAIDDQQYVTNIIEKRIIGRYFCTGGYLFENADDFRDCFRRLERYDDLRLSHMIYAMLLEGAVFQPIFIKDYKDRGTENDFEEERKNGLIEETWKQL